MWENVKVLGYRYRFKVNVGDFGVKVGRRGWIVIYFGVFSI